MLEKNYGILTVEEVSEGFMQLVENCGNGAVVIVFKVFLISLESSKSYNCIFHFLNKKTFRVPHQWYITTSVFLLYMGWPSWQWP